MRGQYVRTPEHTAWMREPWTCPKCGDVRVRAGSVQHLQWCKFDRVAHFWSKVEKSDGCWIFTGAKNDQGYGLFKGRMRKMGKAHRYSYELAFGPIPVGLHVLHRCDNPPCVRPDHLFLGTDADNVADKVRKGRHPGRQLTAAQVAEIRGLFGTISQAEIARRFKVSRTVISKLALGKSYKIMPNAVAAF